MAKQKQQDERFHKEGSNSLFVSDTFVYDVDIYKLEPGRYNLEDSKTISVKTHSPEATNYFTKDNVKFRRETVLIAAPIKWLTDNNYTTEDAKTSKQPSKTKPAQRSVDDRKNG